MALDLPNVMGDERIEEVVVLAGTSVGTTIGAIGLANRHICDQVRGPLEHHRFDDILIVHQDFMEEWHVDSALRSHGAADR